MSGLLDRLDLIVEHRPQLVERRISYDVADMDGTLVGAPGPHGPWHRRKGPLRS